jgi:hypothetical protein
MRTRTRTRTRLGGGVGAKVFEGDEFEGVDVGGFEDDWGCEVCFEGFGPARDAEAPVVAGFEAWEVVFGDGGGEVVAAAAGELEEFGGHDGADGVEACVIGAGAAVAVAVEAGEGGGAAGLEGGSEDVGGHGGIGLRILDCWEEGGGEEAGGEGASRGAVTGTLGGRRRVGVVLGWVGILGLRGVTRSDDGYFGG